MNEYRITVDNKEECEVSQVTVKAETPAGWIEVEIL